MRALRSGELQIGGQKRGAAPLVSTTPVTTQVELTAEFLTYEGAAGVLSSSEASGVIRRDPDTSDPVHNAVPKKTIEKYLSSVVSFFNTITATGIVIHHTAVIPGEKYSASERARYRRISSGARLRNLVFRSRLPCGLSLPHYAQRQSESWQARKV